MQFIIAKSSKTAFICIIGHAQLLNWFDPIDMRVTIGTLSIELPLYAVFNFSCLFITVVLTSLYAAILFVLIILCHDLYFKD
jgi:hypothetical protein